MTSPDRITDVAVIGAGPAGLAAAVTAADGGCRVHACSTSASGPEASTGASSGVPAAAPRRFHHGWPDVRAAAAPLRGPPARRADRPPARARGLAAGRRRRARTVRAMAGERRPAACTVAVRTARGGDRRLRPSAAVPGWTLPGVMAAGAAQSLLKSSGVAAGRRVVVGGHRPLPAPGGRGPRRGRARGSPLSSRPTSPGCLGARLAHGWRRSPRKLAEAAGYAGRLARHRVPATSPARRRRRARRRPARGVTVAPAGPALDAVPGAERADRLRRAGRRLRASSPSSSCCCRPAGRRLRRPLDGTSVVAGRRPVSRPASPTSSPPGS